MLSVACPAPQLQAAADSCIVDWLPCTGQSRASFKPCRLGRNPHHVRARGESHIDWPVLASVVSDLLGAAALPRRPQPWAAWTLLRDALLLHRGA